MRTYWVVIGVLLAIGEAVAAQTPEERAVAFLAREVARWPRENGCFSCHNNGDGVRALFAAIQRGYAVPNEALAESVKWLSAPEGWDSNRANPAFSDKKLARIQFAAALEASPDKDRTALIRAAESLVPYQEGDGSWQVDVGTGSPVTYGAALATYSARRVMQSADPSKFAVPVAKATQWLRAVKPQSLFDSAVLLLAEPLVQRGSVELLVASQTSDGGWGPQRYAPAEPFDTAVVMLALRGVNEPKVTAGAVARARAFLIASQRPEGGWVETTRPPGGQSYAQRISTSSWALLGLLASAPDRR